MAFFAFSGGEKTKPIQSQFKAKQSQFAGLRPEIRKKYADKLAKFNKEFENNGARYLLMMWFIPIFPFFMINVFAGLTRVPMRTFFWTTSVGIFPGTLIYAYSGQQLRTIKDVGDIFSAKVLVAFLLLAGFALIPIIVSKARAMKKENHVSGDLKG